MECEDRATEDQPVMRVGRLHRQRPLPVEGSAAQQGVVVHGDGAERALPARPAASGRPAPGAPGEVAAAERAAARAPLQRYMFLMELQERNERLFYKLMIDNVEELLPVVSTPTVAEACEKYVSIFRRSQGLYISLKTNRNIKCSSCCGSWKFSPYCTKVLEWSDGIPSLTMFL
ncbi:uncharacterized protein LOC123440884 isoform X2 [Hordeum vulgare subsp. vulgare]|uniref:uncharacterized protein LOC123440884 isoform X2 n=1 Tax=Hordeum vulgare subsp. vulgare TaxID=112509 RepID=UPI001D1A4009|nr:uncharacterized protein LOC123440884 isoform X2 [Hordeum vulgare subsp. vulgare]